MRVNWQLKQDSLIVEHQARDLEVRVQVPVQVQNFLLKFDNWKRYNNLFHSVLMIINKVWTITDVRKFISDVSDSNSDLMFIENLEFGSGTHR